MGQNGGGLVIVGGGLASARAIKAYRENGGDGPVTLVSADRFVPYHRPPLSKRFLRGEADVDDTLVEPERFYADHDVELMLETRAASLDTTRKQVLLEDGGAVPYEKLLVASGASPRRIDVPGVELERVFTLRTIDNSAAIREAARDARQAVVVGAGFIGMEVAASLSQLGVEVTLVHRGQGLFEVLRARRLAQYLTELYGRNGVELVLGDEIAAFGGRDGVDSATTRRGRTIQADLAVVGVGVRPNTDWLDGSELELDNGVVVNERYETGVDSVWAAGDVARFYDPVFETHRRIEHWSNANYQGTQVGEVLAGGDARYDIVSTFFTEIFGTSYKVFGDVDTFDDIVFRGTLEDGKAIGFYLRGDRLVACLLVGQDEETENRLKELIRDRATVADVAAVGDDATALDDAFTVSAR